MIDKNLDYSTKYLKVKPSEKAKFNLESRNLCFAIANGSCQRGLLDDTEITVNGRLKVECSLKLCEFSPKQKKNFWSGFWVLCMFNMKRRIKTRENSWKLLRSSQSCYNQHFHSTSTSSLMYQETTDKRKPTWAQWDSQVEEPLNSFTNKTTFVTNCMPSESGAKIKTYAEKYVWEITPKRWTSIALSAICGFAKIYK